MIVLTKSEYEAKQLRDTTVAQRQSEGFTRNPDSVVFYKAELHIITRYGSANTAHDRLLSYAYDVSPVDSRESITLSN